MQHIFRMTKAIFLITSKLQGGAWGGWWAASCVQLDFRQKKVNS